MSSVLRRNRQRRLCCLQIMASHHEEFWQEHRHSAHPRRGWRCQRGARRLTACTSAGCWRCGGRGTPPPPAHPASAGSSATPRALRWEPGGVNVPLLLGVNFGTIGLCPTCLNQAPDPLGSACWLLPGSRTSSMVQAGSRGWARGLHSTQACARFSCAAPPSCIQLRHPTFVDEHARVGCEAREGEADVLVHFDHLARAAGVLQLGRALALGACGHVPATAGD